MLPERILEFWFQELSPSDWWKKSEDLDSRIASEFSEVYRQAQKGELWSWRSTPEGRLAEIIVLDQFSRNIFRDKPEAFAQDILAVTLSCEAVRNGILKDLPTKQAAFALMPFLHSESKDLQKYGWEQFKNLGDDGFITACESHKNIVDRFGRFPHRNKILERKSTAEELKFLEGPNSSF